MFDALQCLGLFGKQEKNLIKQARESKPLYYTPIYGQKLLAF